MDISADDLMPFEQMCRRAGFGVQNGYSLASQGKGPFPIRGVPRAAALAWLESRGADAGALPPGDLIPVPALCRTSGVSPTYYYRQVRQGKAPRQLKGVLKSEATAWLDARAAEAAAKQPRPPGAAQAV